MTSKVESSLAVKMEKPRILIVDDEESIVFTLKTLFKHYDVTAFSRSSEAFECLKSGKNFDILLIDFRMQGINGLDLLSEAKKNLSSYKAIIITAYSSRDLLEKGLNESLFDRVVNKPFEPSELAALVDASLALLEKERLDKEHYSHLESQIAYIAGTIRKENVFLIHECQKMREILSLTQKFAASNANVLIEGESGVGKEIVANLIHWKSQRCDKPIIKVNCSAIPENLFESELFGYKKGAFTGAASDKPGKFQLANGGTLFLDEIGELPLNQQSKILRAIEDFEISPLGSTEAEKVDVRIICATNRNLEEMANQKLFRNDLRFRLNILSLQIPPLRERRQDIPLLCVYFLSEIANREGQITKHMDIDCLEYVSMLDLPGNVRELKNLIYKAFIMTEGNIITKADIESVFSGTVSKKEPESLFERSLTISELESEYIVYTLARYDYHLTEAAKSLGMEASNLSRKLKNMGISVKNKKSRIQENIASL